MYVMLPKVLVFYYVMSFESLSFLIAGILCFLYSVLFVKKLVWM
jgi:hypothetical protein